MRGLAFALVALLLTACGDAFPKSLTLDNRSSAPLTDVSVNFAGDGTHVGKLVRGQFVNFSSIRGREGDLCVSFFQRGEKHGYSLGYITRNLPVRCRLRVSDDAMWGECNGHTQPLVRQSEKWMVAECGRPSRG